MQTHEWDAVVIGGGTAGLSAAQMLGRARRRTLVIDGGSARNRFASHMHGVLGHDGIDPAELLQRGREELTRYGVRVERGEVAGLTDDGERMRIVRADGTVDLARAVVIATGIRDVLPPVAGLAPLWGRAVLHCPYCHGWEVAGQRLGVLATTAASIHQIELVRQWSDRVTAFTAAAGPLDPDVRNRLLARDIRIVESPVTSVVTAGGELTAAVDASGATHPIDALFVAPIPEVNVEFAAELSLARADQSGTPVSAHGPLAVDAIGATSHPRVWAAGNVTAPYGNVPVSMGAGSMAGAAANAALVAEDARRAVDARRRERNRTWEQRYADQERVWSGRVNPTLREVVDALEPRTALDVGCGEGADAVWLAERGWQVTAIDVSATAISRAAAAARERGIDQERLRFVVADATEALPVVSRPGASRPGASRPGASSAGGLSSEGGEFDLVTSSFLHSWEEDFPRIALLRAAADRVAPGGHLLVISHAAPPPWSDSQHAHATVMRTPDEEFALLSLDPGEWAPVIVEVRRREATSPTGEATHLDDGVLLLQRAHRSDRE